MLFSFLLLRLPRQRWKSAEEELVAAGWIRWIRLEDFAADSFYNLAMAQVRPS
jgi:hypothetical protein